MTMVDEKSEPLGSLRRLDGDEVLHWLLTRSERGTRVVQDLLGLLRDDDRILMSLIRRNQVLESLAWTDALTGLRNRRGFDEEMQREEARAARFQLPAAVVLLDVRGLKAVNDLYGQLVGDSLLRAASGALLAVARETDVVARFGGDEFAVLLPNAEVSGATAFYERLRLTARFRLTATGEPMPIGFAHGVASRTEAGSMHSALELASHRLLLDKNQRPA